MDLGEVAVLRRFDVETYYRMAEVGIFGPDDRVELIEGQIIDMAPIGLEHAATVNHLTRTLVLTFEGKAEVSVQNPVSVDRYNEPQPDFVVMRLREDHYRTKRAGAGDVLLVVEVADSSVRFDRAVKLPIYARAGFMEVWIVDIRARRVEVYRGDGLAEVTSFAAEERIALAAAPEIVVELGRLFG